MACWKISCSVKDAVALFNTLALLQVRNAIQRMKDKKKALSFTVSHKEVLLPSLFIMYPPEEGLKCVRTPLRRCYWKEVSNFSLVYDRGCLSSLQSSWTMHFQR